MNLLKKLRSIFFNEPEEEVTTSEKPSVISKDKCYWCEEYFGPGEFQKKFNKRWFHRRCYKAMIKQAKKDLRLPIS